MSPSSAPEPMLTRRAAMGAIGVLGAGVALVSVSGCDLRDLTGRDNTGRTDPAAAADRARADEALRLTRGAIVQIETTVTRHPATSSDLASVVAMHQAHLAVLVHAIPGASATSSPGPSTGASTGATATPPTIAANQRTAVAALADLERSASLRLTGLAQRAHNGALARLLASMAAAISQRLDQWPA